MNARAVLLVAVTAVLATIGLAVAGEPARTYRDYDFGTFWVMGRMVLDGTDQYDYAAILAAHQAIGSRALTLVLPGTASAYPLTTSLIFVPFALVPFALAAPLWLVSQIIVAGVALIALARVVVPDTLRRDAFVLFGLLAASQPAWLLVQYGNMSGLLLAIAAATTAFLLARHAAAAGVGAGALVLVKPHPLLVALCLIPVALPRAVATRALVAAASTVLLVVVASIALEPTWIRDWASQLSAVAGFGMRVRLPTLFGLLGPDLALLSWGILAALVLGLFLYLRTGPPLPLGIATAVCVSLFATPFGHSFDHVILAIPLLVALGEVRDAVPWRRAIALAGLALAFVVTPWLLYVAAFRRGDESLNAITPLAVLFALALASWLGREPTTFTDQHDGTPQDPPASVSV